MGKTAKKTVKSYSAHEEMLHSLTHGFGAVLGVFGTILLIMRALERNSMVAVVASAIYGGSLILLFSMSSIYHAAKDVKVKKFLRILDHSSIFLLIAGSYTPYSLITLRDSPKGIIIFWVVWIAAILGIILNVISIEKFKHVSIALYLLMGWAVVFDWKGVSTALAPMGLWLLIGGGLAYTVGILFYVRKGKAYMHAIWHVFVLVGSLMHFFSIYNYVIAVA